MKRYVNDNNVNEQINLIASYAKEGLSNAEIATKLNEKGLKNLSSEDGVWVEEKIQEIKNSFKLNEEDSYLYSVGYKIGKLSQLKHIQVIMVVIAFACAWYVYDSFFSGTAKAEQVVMNEINIHKCKILGSKKNANNDYEVAVRCSDDLTGYYVVNGITFNITKSFHN